MVDGSGDEDNLDSGILVFAEVEQTLLVEATLRSSVTITVPGQC